MSWLERQEPAALKESQACPGRLDATAQPVPKDRKVYKASKVYQVSKAHKACKALRELQVLKGNPGSLCRRVSHHLARQIARLAKTEDVRSREREGEHRWRSVRRTQSNEA